MLVGHVKATCSNHAINLNSQAQAFLNMFLVYAYNENIRLQGFLLNQSWLAQPVSRFVDMNDICRELLLLTMNVYNYAYVI